MDIAKSIILSVVQGLTEFLPVSSSGHLVIVRELINMDEGLVTFDILLHLGTLISVFIVFRNEVKALIMAIIGIIYDVFRGSDIKTAVYKNHYRRLALLIIIASVPTAIMGLVFKHFIYTVFSSKQAVGIFLLATGTVIWISERVPQANIRLSNLSLWKAFGIGIAQGFAILPGFSRSGATISACLFAGLHRDDAIGFSFLLSIPTILGAGILEMKNISLLQFTMDSQLPVIIGFIASVISGYLAIKLLLTIVRRHRLTVFSVYTWVLGIIIIIWSIV